jgi:hypothetical protein
MSRWNMRAVALERLRRDDAFIAYDDGDDFWWSPVIFENWITVRNVN